MFVWVVIVREIFPTGSRNVEIKALENREAAFKYLRMYGIKSPDEGEYIGGDYWYCDTKPNYDISLMKKIIWKEKEIDDILLHNKTR